MRKLMIFIRKLMIFINYSKITTYQLPHKNKQYVIAASQGLRMKNVE